jgi:uncharacterized membrane protein
MDQIQSNEQLKQPYSTGSMIGLVILSILIPLAGIIIGRPKPRKNETPKRARQSQTLWIIGLCLIVLGVLAQLI